LARLGFGRDAQSAHRQPDSVRPRLFGPALVAVRRISRGAMARLLIR